jgi:hypothetical protein
MPCEAWTAELHRPQTAMAHKMVVRQTTDFWTKAWRAPIPAPKTKCSPASFLSSTYSQ